MEELSFEALALLTVLEDRQSLSNELEAWFVKEFPGSSYEDSLTALRAAGLIDRAVSWRLEEQRGVRFNQLSTLHLRTY
ncbi:hypothetical protein GCM10015535_36070 [Streptomyces gelaticus]|uniref:Uncharacterized protein n=1 Tax=Streptomyces gelaticus TaxID=285446 RepID=A0ABQ2VZW0_9ACTN|nr:hypothetical protein GCM10015535_36070 [Streptomyces gelaticus]